MIDESKNEEGLLQIIEDLNFFINKKIVADIYEERNKLEELLEDRKLARKLLIEIQKKN